MPKIREPLELLRSQTADKKFNHMNYTKNSAKLKIKIIVKSMLIAIGVRFVDCDLIRKAITLLVNKFGLEEL